MSDTEPTVGRIVHYTGIQHYPITQPIAAIITEVLPPQKDQPRLVRLDIRWPTFSEPNFTNNLFPYAEEPKPGHWNWPPRA
jgi:hypothetical protein